MMLIMMPAMMLLISYTFPSGLVLYWTVSNLLGIGHQYWIRKTERPTAGLLETRSCRDRTAGPRRINRREKQMYDARQEPNEFVADSLEEARAKAAEFFGTEASELQIVVPAVGEIFGAGGRTVIVAVPKSVSASAAGVVEWPRAVAVKSVAAGARRVAASVAAGEIAASDPSVGKRAERSRGTWRTSAAGRGEREERPERRRAGGTISLSARTVAIAPRASARPGAGKWPATSRGTRGARRERAEGRGDDRGRERVSEENGNRGERLPTVADSTRDRPGQARRCGGVPSRCGRADEARDLSRSPRLRRGIS